MKNDDKQISRLDKMKINCSTEEFFDHPYYRLNKLFLRLVGIWPYQAHSTRVIILTLLALSIISIIIPEVFKMRKNIANGAINNVFDGVAPMMAMFVMHMKKLLIRMHNDWKNIKNESEIEILRRYAKQGRVSTVYYSVYIYVSMSVYVIMPLYPKILDMISPLNESRPTKFLFETDYGVDPEKYFYPIILHSYIETIQVVTYVVAVDTMYMVYSQHACALFTITGYKVQQSTALYFSNIAENKDATLVNVDACEKDQNLELENKAYQECVSAVKMHHNALQFAEVLESAYTVSLLLQVGASLLLMSISGVQGFRMKDVWNDDVRTFESISPIIVVAIILAKFFNGIINKHKMSTMLVRIQDDWKSLADVEDLQILRKYASNGRKLIIYYSVYIFSSMTMYIVLPLSPQFLDLVSPLNESRPRKYLYEAEYGLDPDESYYLILAHSYVVTIMVITILVVVDTTYVMYAQHVCGLFAITGCQLQRAIAVMSVHSFSQIQHMKRSTDCFGESRNLRLENEAYQRYVSCIKSHQNTLKFAELLDSTYSVSLFFQIGLNLISISVAGVLTVLNLNNKDNVIRFGSFTLGQMLHLFFNSIPGQKVMDHSSKVFDDTYNSKWYLTAPRIKKLIRMVMTRSFYPSTLTAGKLYVMSMINFSSVIQTSLSYFTVLCSLQ